MGWRPPAQRGPGSDLDVSPDVGRVAQRQRADEEAVHCVEVQGPDRLVGKHLNSNKKKTCSRRSTS